ncbi:MAG: hypothetical protein WC506_00060 [Candidatus Micrarchaeia archaeon]
MVAINNLEKLFSALSKGPITFNKLCRASRLHPRTVRRYLKVVEYIQMQEKVTIEREGFKVVIRKK